MLSFLRVDIFLKFHLLLEHSIPYHICTVDGFVDLSFYFKFIKKVRIQSFFGFTISSVWTKHEFDEQLLVKLVITSN